MQRRQNALRYRRTVLVFTFQTRMVKLEPQIPDFTDFEDRTLVHHVRDWFSGAAAYFGWMREVKRENTRCGLRPMSDKAASQKTRSPEGCDENRPAAALLLSHVSIQICSFVAPCRRPILIATPLNQSRTWCTSAICVSRVICGKSVSVFG